MQPVCYHFAGNTRVDLLGLLQSFVNEMKLPFTKNNQSRTRKWAGGILADDGSQSSPPPSSSKLWSNCSSKVQSLLALGESTRYIVVVNYNPPYLNIIRGVCVWEPNVPACLNFAFLSHNVLGEKGFTVSKNILIVHYWKCNEHSGILGPLFN